jgi:DNA-directed RNA polymerase specialized sigma24 family protein
MPHPIRMPTTRPVRSRRLWQRPPVTGIVGHIEPRIPALRRYAGSLLRDRQEVDDLVDDCLVRALDRLHTRQSEAEIRPWLFAIMHNVFVDRTRQKQARGAAEPLDSVAGSTLGVDARQEAYVQVREVMRVVELLPVELR